MRNNLHNDIRGCGSATACGALLLMQLLSGCVSTPPNDGSQDWLDSVSAMVEMIDDPELRSPALAGLAIELAHRGDEKAEELLSRAFGVR